MRHAPGPWKLAGRVPERHAIAINDSDGLLVAEARGAGGPWSIVGFNARLIAAAPELLAALKLALLTLNARNGPLASERDAASEQARAAIARAKGEA